MRNLFFRLYLFATLTFVALGWSIDTFYSQYSQQAQLTSDIDLHKGSLFLIHRELSRYPAHEQNDYLKAIRGSFGYPIALATVEEVLRMPQVGEQLTPSQQAYLKQGGIVSVLDESQSISWYLQKRPESDQVILLGPIVYDLPNQADTLISMIFLAVLAIAVFFWVWPISRSILALTKTAEAFGKGDLTARVNTELTTPLRVLALRFNAMASRIQRLITSHKELSHAVSHELRTPIARIRFAMEMVREVEESQVREKYLMNMDDNIEQLDSLVDELLMYARFDREELQLNIGAHDLCQLSSEVLAKFELTDDRLSFHLECASQAMMWYCDGEAMTRVLDNLVRNGVRYANTQVQISLSRDNGGLRIAVNDDGPGIPEVDRATLFEPFVRLDQSRDRQSGGIGLGLAIVKRYISLHQGLVSIQQSQLGGASFVIWLPDLAKTQIEA